MAFATVRQPHWRILIGYWLEDQFYFISYYFFFIVLTLNFINYSSFNEK